MTTPNDPLFPQQPQFRLIGDIARVWQEVTGRGVAVAVFDGGIEATHPDLAANYHHRPFVASGGGVFGPAPLAAGDWHGTAVAGVIGAVQGNGTGGSGVAPGVQLTGLNFLDAIQPQPFPVWLEALRWAGGFDVLNNSWNSPPNYGPGQSPVPGTGRAEMLAALADIAATGRGGLGTVIVQAAGNQGQNAQGDGLNTSRHTITVGATDGSGMAAVYSNWGTTLLLAAPGQVVTTDTTGAAGGVAGDYRSAQGTSFATPVVSGVVALMLEANPGLGWRDVQNILAASASLTGSAPGAAPAGAERGGWFATGGAGWNGGGAAYHLSYGYGMADAFAAVRMAEAWQLLHGTAQTSATERSVSVAMSGSRSIADQARTEVALTVVGGVAIEHIEVALRITHSWAADLEVSLVSPGGVAFPLLLREGGNTLMDLGWSWVFGVEAARGLSSAGTWRLWIDDVEAGDSGRLDALSLRFLGAEAAPFRVHHLTEDFPALAAWQPARATIATGTADRLNLSAIADDVSVSLAAGGAVSVEGARWATLSGRVAQAVLGDGDDVATGHDFGVVLHGMRGNDTLAGGLGADRLFGGPGTDILFGRGGGDLLDGGEGRDLAVLDALRRQGTLREASGDVLFTTAAATDTLRGIETALFRDGRVTFDADEIAAQVARLYQAALGRLPDPFGLSFWTEGLEGGRFALPGIAQGFLGSPEFAERYPSVDVGDFVTLLYANVLGRAPDAGGAAFWTGRLAGGAPREAVLLDFSESIENRARTAELVENGLWIADGDALTVLRSYATILDRLPDPGGLVFWTGELARGALDYDGLAGSFIGSVEFQSRYGALSNREFVELLYLNALDRPGDSGGIAFFTDRLDSGAWTRADVVETFAFASEMDARLSPYAADGIAFA